MAPLRPQTKSNHGVGGLKSCLNVNIPEVGDLLSVQNVEMYQIATFLEGVGLQFTMTSFVDSTINSATSTLFRGPKALLKSQDSVMRKSIQEPMTHLHQTTFGVVCPILKADC